MWGDSSSWMIQFSSVLRGGNSSLILHEHCNSLVRGLPLVLLVVLDEVLLVRGLVGPQVSGLGVQGAVIVGFG